MLSLQRLAAQISIPGILNWVPSNPDGQGAAPFCRVLSLNDSTVPILSQLNAEKGIQEVMRTVCRRGTAVDCPPRAGRRTFTESLRNPVGCQKSAEQEHAQFQILRRALDPRSRPIPSGLADLNSDK